MHTIERTWRAWSVCAAVCIGGAAAIAQPPADKPRTDLRVQRIALFSSGVGYFESQAEVQGNAAAELTFRTDQINDILKSLIVRDLGGGQVGVVGYASRDPIEKTLRSFGVDITGKPTLAQLLDQLRGEPVEIAAPRSLRGVIVGVEKQKKAVGDTAIEYDALTLLTDAGIEQVAIDELRGLKLTNEKVAGELRQALATLAAGHSADKKTVLIAFNGDGKRTVKAAYLLEAPIWKTSYRLALSKEGKPFLQGWATVENATEEDWKDVQLSLVSGRPISFTMDLYTPLYVPRPHEELELYASLRAPELKDAAAVRHTMAPSGGAGGRPLRLLFSKADAPAAEMDGDEGSTASLRGDSVRSIATTAEAGELFEYRIDAPVSIARQHSAMLPIVNEEIAGEKLSIYSEGTHERHPLNALRVENTTKLHLMQGPVTLFDDGVYAGDAKLPDLQPAEKRLIAYALDLTVEVTTESGDEPQTAEVVSLRAANGVLIVEKRYISQLVYNARNKSERPRTLLIEHPRIAEWRLVEPPQAFEQTEDQYRFKLELPGGQQQSLKVRAETVASERITLLDAHFDLLALHIRGRVISPALKAALERVVALRGELEALNRARTAVEQRLTEAANEQGRIRENLRTIEKGGDVYARQLRKFDELETQIETLKNEVEQKRASADAKRDELAAFIAGLDVK